MKTLKYLIISFLFLSVISCTTSSNMGTGLDKLFQSKRYKETLKERDSLFAVNRQLMTDTSNLGTQIKSLQREIKKMGEKYTTLNTQFTTLNTQFSALNDENLKLKADYKSLSEESERKLAKLQGELNAKPIEEPKKDTLLIKREQKIEEIKAMLSKQDSIARELQDNISNALTGFAPEELSLEMINGEIFVTMTDKLLFKAVSATVEDKGRKALKKMAVVLNRTPDIGVSIETFTDNSPIKSPLYKDNWDLSVARAATIIRILSEEYDVSPAKLSATGKGEFFPIASNKTAEGRAKNRRTEIRISPKMDELFKFLEKK